MKIDRIGRSLRDPFFGWWIVGGGVLLQLLVSGLLMQAYGTYAAVWQAEFGWSATTFATAFAIQRLVMAVLSPVQGRLLQRFGPRTVMQVGMTLLAAGFFLLSRIDSVAAFYGTFLVMAFGAGLGGFLSLTTTIVNWFDRRRSSALALTQVGSSIGGLAVPAIAWAFTTYGWRPTAVASGVLILVLGLPITALMRRSPEAYGMRPDGDEPDADEPDAGGPGTDGSGARDAEAPDDAAARRAASAVRPERDFSAREALRTRAFWFITFGHASAVTVVAAIAVHLVVHLSEGVGIGLQAAATVVAVMTAVRIVGQLAGGLAGDRFDKRAIASVAMLAHAGALLAVAHGSGTVPILGFAFVHGLAWGVRGPIMQAMRADYFGRRSFPTIMGISFSFVMLGQMAGPLVAGALADATGDYRAGFTVLAAWVALASLFFVFATPPRRAPGGGGDGGPERRSAT